VALLAICTLAGTAAGEGLATGAVVHPGVVYTNERVAAVPWSAHVVRWARTNAAFELHSAHAGGAAFGLSTLTAQLELLDPTLGEPVAAVNGDYYRWESACAGDPRGLQIVASEVISAPTGGVSFWVDAAGQPQCTNVTSRFTAIWPNGTASPFGLNEERAPDGIVLYTAAAGQSTRTSRGRDVVLERQGEGPWLPLRMGLSYTARVREVCDGGNAVLRSGTMVLSIGRRVQPPPPIEPGAVVRFVTASFPDLRGVATAISGGPVLLRKGRVQRIDVSESESYQASTMFERHPRSAVGWNRSEFFLVTVDGRQQGLSVGMTLKEFGAYLLKLGCEDAMNFDGGGSATLWCAGKVRNRPCDGGERVIANSLVLMRKGGGAGGVTSGVEEAAP
jgi:hypothetical protein